MKNKIKEKLNHEIMITSAYDVMMILCSGDPMMNEEKSVIHNGKFTNNVVFQMNDDYTEIDMDGLIHFWYNIHEKTFIAVHPGNEIVLTACNDAKIFNKWLGKMEVGKVES
jgi:hypothetical protein